MCFPTSTYQLEIQSLSFTLILTAHFRNSVKKKNSTVANYCQIPANISNMPKSHELYLANVLHHLANSNSIHKMNLFS